MRVMVSLNLADIMTATRPTTPPETDPTGPGQESQERGNPRKRKDKKPQNRTADKADEIRI
jgi:hypothetical protein